MVELLSETERAALILSYTCWLSNPDAVDYDDLHDKLKRVSSDIQNKLIQVGLCTRSKRHHHLHPNTLPVYVEHNRRFLQSFVPTPPLKIVSYHGVITYKKNAIEELEAITEFDESVNYEKYFSQFHDPTKLSVPKGKINFIGIVSFLDLIKTVDTSNIYNLHTFLEFINVVAYRSKTRENETNWGLMVTMKSHIKYKTSKNRMSFLSPSSHAGCKLYDVDDTNYFYWTSFHLSESRKQSTINPEDDLTLSVCGLTWVLANLDEPVSKRFLPHLFAQQATPNEFIFTVEYKHLKVDNKFIKMEHLCRLCVYFGPKHVNSRKHNGIKLYKKLNLPVSCNECYKKSKKDFEFNFGLCQDCGVDIYANVCDRCAKNSSLMYHLCICHGQPPENKCEPGIHSGFPIMRIGDNDNVFCDICFGNNPLGPETVGHITQ
jgi:hypothetical protein